MRVKDYIEKNRIGHTLMSSILRAMKLPKGSRFLVESKVNKWRNAHPGHRADDVYKRKGKTGV